MNREKPELVKDNVIEFRKDFNTVHYCFNDGIEAHKLFKIL
jgi:hypothetical protein